MEFLLLRFKKGTSGFALNKSSLFNRKNYSTNSNRYLWSCKGHDLVKTKYSTIGTKTRGTLNNCTNGLTHGEHILLVRENWAGYFKRPASNTLSAKAQLTQNRYMGSSSSNGSYGWANSTTSDDIYDRWNVTASGTDETEDYRNAANTFDGLLRLIHIIQHQHQEKEQIWEDLGMKVQCQES